jgi:hypothetical protein
MKNKNVFGSRVRSIAIAIFVWQQDVKGVLETKDNIVSAMQKKVGISIYVMCDTKKKLLL